MAGFLFYTQNYLGGHDMEQQRVAVESKLRAGPGALRILDTTCTTIEARRRKVGARQHQTYSSPSKDLRNR